MTAIPTKLLLDSNIWIDMFAGDRPGRRDALKLMNWASEQEAALLYSASSVKDLYYMVKLEEKRKVRAEGREVTHATAAAIDEYAWGCVHLMEELATVVPLDQSDIWIATKYRAIHADFEDDLVLAAAERAKPDFLVTNDEALIRHAPVAALTPREVLTLVSA